MQGGSVCDFTTKEGGIVLCPLDVQPFEPHCPARAQIILKNNFDIQLRHSCFLSSSSLPKRNELGICQVAMKGLVLGLGEMFRADQGLLRAQWTPYGSQLPVYDRSRHYVP